MTMIELHYFGSIDFNALREVRVLSPPCYRFRFATMSRNRYDELMQKTFLPLVVIFLLCFSFAPILQAQQPETPGNSWRIGASATQGMGQIYTSLDGEVGSTTDDWLGLALLVPFSAGKLISDNFELGFHGQGRFWVGNDEMVNVGYSGSTVGLAIENLNLHGRFYLDSIQELGLSPWGQISLGEIPYFRLGSGLDASYGSVDTSVIQLDFPDTVSINASIGGSYRFADAASLDVEIPIFSKAGGDSSVVTGIDHDPYVLFGFSVWF